MSLRIPGGGSASPTTHGTVDSKLQYVHMKGQDIFKVAVKNLLSASRNALERAGMTKGDIDWVCAHQANKRILDSTLERLEIPASKCWMNLEKYGNTSSASLPMTLDEANRAGWLKPGDTILTTAIGAGMAWGAGLIRW
jgi:3-oxoacyl-[acyl-carrier-protein] synthase-3